VATQAPGQLWHSGAIGRVKYSVTYLSFGSFNAPYNPVHFMYEKRIASIQFLILRLLVPKITVTTVRPRLSNNVGLARYPENQNQACSHGGIRGQSPLNLFKLLQILFCQENFFLKNIIKTEVLTP